MVRMCSPSIGDEHDIYTCLIPFPNERDIQIRSWPKIKANWDQKMWKLFSPILKVVYKCVFGKRICQFGTIAPVLTEWLYLFRDNPFQPNGCVYSVSGYVCLKWLCQFQLNKFVCSEWWHTFWLNGCIYSERLHPNSYIKGRFYSKMNY